MVSFTPAAEAELGVVIASPGSWLGVERVRERLDRASGHAAGWGHRHRLLVAALTVRPPPSMLICPFFRDRG